MKVKFLLSFFSLLFFFQATAQQRSITGMVNSSKDGTPIADASVIVVGENQGVKTISDGSFSINVSANAKQLQISYVGFETQMVNISSASNVSVSLVNSSESLQDVVVVGYNTQKKASITGAISTVNMGDLEERRVPDVAQALQGQVAGVQVSQSTGAPGDPINIRIRGEGTIGNNSPLFIV